MRLSRSAREEERKIEWERQQQQYEAEQARRTPVRKARLDTFKHILRGQKGEEDVLGSVSYCLAERPSVCALTCSTRAAFLWNG
jgi:hypothetical protein